MSQNGRIGKLEKETAPKGAYLLVDPVLPDFREWLNDLSNAERWSWSAELSDPSHVLRACEAEIGPIDLGGRKAKMAQVFGPAAQAKWKEKVAKSWSEIKGQTAPQPSEKERRKILAGALERLPDEFLDWARALIMSRQIELVYGTDIRYLSRDFIAVKILHKSGSLVSGSWLEVALERIQKNKKRRERKGSVNESSKI